MSLSAFYNMASLALGLAAWILPLLGLAQRRKARFPACYSLASFGACLVALTMQFFEIRHRVAIHDLSAVMDTIDALAGVAAILAVVTFLLNAALLWAVGRSRA